MCEDMTAPQNRSCMSMVRCNLKVLKWQKLEHKKSQLYTQFPFHPSICKTFRGGGGGVGFIYAISDDNKSTTCCPSLSCSVSP